MKNNKNIKILKLFEINLEEKQLLNEFFDILIQENNLIELELNFNNDDYNKNKYNFNKIYEIKSLKKLKISKTKFINDLMMNIKEENNNLNSIILII